MQHSNDKLRMLLQVGVKVLIINDKGQYLFLRRSLQKYPDLDQQWDIPGGRINPGEALPKALSREVKEETGLEIVGEPRLLAAQDIFISAAQKHVVRLTYQVSASGDITLSDEHDEYRWMELDQACSQPGLDEYVRRVVDERQAD